MTAIRWQDLSLTERERAYSPSSCIGGNYQPFVAAYKTKSIEAVAACALASAQRHELRYGAKAANRIDVWVPKRTTAQIQGQAPEPSLLVFIHGGYWQELSAADSLFAASDCIAHGIAFAAIDYTLAPQASLNEIVDECCQAVACLIANAAILGFDASRVVVAGSSAGAHLAAMVAKANLNQNTAGAMSTLHAVVLVSGIYDLTPLIGTSINDALGLDVAKALAVSPIKGLLAGFARSVVCWGEVETDEFKRQSQCFVRTLRQANCNRAAFSCDAFEVPERNHFDVILELINPATALGQKTLALFNR